MPRFVSSLSGSELVLHRCRALQHEPDAFSDLISCLLAGRGPACWSAWLSCLSAWLGSVDDRVDGLHGVLGQGWQCREGLLHLAGQERPGSDDPGQVA